MQRIVHGTEQREAKKSNREEKEKFEKIFSNFEKRKRKGFHFSRFERRKRNFLNDSPLSRREREMDIIFSRFERRKRISTSLFEKFSLSAKLCQSYCDSQSFRESESFTLISFSVRIVILAAMLCINHGNYFYMSEHPHVWRRLC